MARALRRRSAFGSRRRLALRPRWRTRVASRASRAERLERRAADVITYPAAVLVAPRSIDLREQRLEKRLAKGEVLLSVSYAGVCGTDVAMARGDYTVPLPLIPGHEIVARVADAPSRSPAARLIGEPVACEINNSCTAYGHEQVCEACRRGLPTHCLRRTVTGIIHHPGAFAR